jgi:opacity protein-like surface antigen
MPPFSTGVSILPLSLVLLVAPSQLSAETAGPRPHALELGFYGGAFLASPDHGMMSDGGAQISLDRAGLDFALRLAYLPFTFLGVEAEAGHVSISSPTFRDTEMYTLRGHVLALYPARLSPFVLAGAGVLGLTGPDDAMGSDNGLAFHWGVGARYHLTREVQARVEGRHILAPGDAGLAHHFEILTGLAFTLVSAGS